MSEIKTSLLKYQNFICLIRDFFYKRKVVEVTTPSLLLTPTSDVYIDSISMEINEDIYQNSKRYLHTSPEIEMKRLILKGSGDIFQISKVFRDNEHGRFNSNEFTMLEYYSAYADFNDQMDFIEELFKSISEKVLGSTKINNESIRFDFSRPFDRVSLKEAVAEKLAISTEALNKREVLEEAGKNC